MRKNLLLSAAFVSLIVMLSSCQAIGDIFKAGVWVGVIVVVIIVALVIWLLGKMSK